MAWIAVSRNKGLVCLLLADFVAKVAAEPLASKNAQQEKWIFE
jgi:hypothetical protein